MKLMRATADDPAALPGTSVLSPSRFLVHGPKTNKPAAQVQQASTKHGQPITCKYTISYLNCSAQEKKTI